MSSLKLERLQKVLAHAGVASRRKCEEIVRQGKVRVNKEVITRLGFLVDPGRDEITVNGRGISLEPKVYILCNKPAGYITTARDTHRRKTVLDLIPKKGLRIFPVGRLDKDTTGALLLTNDGELAYRLTHPRFGVPKTYEVNFKGFLREKEIAKLERGLKLEGKFTAPAKVNVLAKGRSRSQAQIQIHEGRKRQVRRMFEAIGHPVMKLKRISYGNLMLSDLKEGRLRRLTHHEVARLKEMVGL